MSATIDRPPRPRSPRRWLRLEALRLRRATRRLPGARWLAAHQIRPARLRRPRIHLVVPPEVRETARRIARRLGTRGIVAVSVAGAVLLFVAGVAVATFYYQYGFHPERNTAAWSSLQPRFAGTTTGACASCHGTESAHVAAREHAGVSCESCHGPMAGHELAGAVTRYEITEPASKQLCSACHEAVEGRPTTIAQVVTSAHYAPGTCVECHDPHSTVPREVPKIVHPLDKLPDCKTCHGPGGLEAVPATHPFYANEQCRSCHQQLTVSGS